MPSIDRRHYPLLDLVRFCAAMLVLFGHARGALLVGINSVEYPTSMIKAFYLASSLQHEAVVVFFVVSGFLIGGDIWQRMKSRTFNLRSYLINRFARVYLVLIPSLALVAILAWISTYFLNSTRFYSAIFLNDPNQKLTWDLLACHVASLQAVYCSPWKANLPLWSLGFEWSFYLIGPAAIAVFIAPMNFLSRSVIALVALYVLIHLETTVPDFSEWWAIWTLGIVAAVFCKKFFVPTFVGLSGVAVALTAIVISRAKIVDLSYTDAAIAIGITLALCCRNIVNINFKSRVVDRGARLSFSLYMIHVPVCYFVGSLIERYAGWPSTLVQPDWRGIAMMICLTTAAILSAWAFAMGTEDNTSAVRKYLQALVEKRRGLKISGSHVP